MLINKTLKELGFTRNYKLQDKVAGVVETFERDFIVKELVLEENKQITIFYETTWTAKVFSITFGSNTNKVFYNKLRKVIGV